MLVSTPTLPVDRTCTIHTLPIPPHNAQRSLALADLLCLALLPGRHQLSQLRTLESTTALHTASIPGGRGGRYRSSHPGGSSHGLLPPLVRFGEILERREKLVDIFVLPCHLFHDRRREVSAVVVVALDQAEPGLPAQRHRLVAENSFDSRPLLCRELRLEEVRRHLQRSRVTGIGMAMGIGGTGRGGAETQQKVHILLYGIAVMQYSVW